jgi:hypothetical protein
MNIHSKIMSNIVWEESFPILKDKRIQNSKRDIGIIAIAILLSLKRESTTTRKREQSVESGGRLIMHRTEAMCGGNPRLISLSNVNWQASR